MSEHRLSAARQPAVKGAWVSGMAAYQELVRRGRARLRRLLGAPGARADQLEERRSRRVLNADTPPFFKWFEDGTLNASYNCLDRNVERGLGDKTAIIFEADDGAVTKVTLRRAARAHLPARQRAEGARRR